MGRSGNLGENPYYFGYWSFLNGKPVYKYYYPALLKIIEK